MVSGQQLCADEEVFASPERVHALTENSDEELMLAFADGNAAAFDELYRRHKAGLYRFIRRGLNAAVSADEVFQDVWERIIKARRRYQPDARFQTYLYRVARNRVIDLYRTRRPEALPEPDQLAAEASAPDPDLNDAALALQRALADLPLEQRTTVLLRLERDMSLGEIAEVCGCGRETVKSRLRYAMNKLRDALQHCEAAQNVVGHAPARSKK